jgi:hypothetical protein
MKVRASLFSLIALIACCIVISGCANAQTQAPEAPSKDQTGKQSPSTSGDAEAIRAQQLQLVKVPLKVTATVKKMLRYDDRGLPHEKFLLVLSNGSTILVAHNTKMAPYVPIQAGDIVTVSGEFIWNDKGGLIHWTHHTDTPNHVGGYIEFKGKRYE